MWLMTSGNFFMPHLHILWLCMKTTISLITLCSLISLALPVSAQEGPRILDRELSRGPCSQQTGRDKLRCESRQQSIIDNADDVRAQRSLSSSSGRSGIIRILRIERERRTAINAKLVERRRTLQKASEDQDINTRRVDYLQEHRQNILACMSEATPRAKARCLENAQNKVRASMRSQMSILNSPKIELDE